MAMYIKTYRKFTRKAFLPTVLVLMESICFPSFTELPKDYNAMKGGTK